MKIASQVQTAAQLQSAPLGKPAARQALEAMARQLVDGHSGRIKSGYLKLSDAGSMNAGGFLTKGSHAKATGAVKEMLLQAYGRSLGVAGTEQLDKALTAYLDTTGGALGTRSFVKLVRSLERAVAEFDGQSPPSDGQSGLLNIPSRLDLSELLPDSPAQPSPPSPAPEQAQTAQPSAAVSPASTNPTGARPALSREKVDQFVEQLKNKRGSPISDAALQQFQALGYELKGSARHFMAFQQVMFPAVSALNQAAAVQGPGAPSTFAMGDADGSMARMVLHAMASGVAELPQESMATLARLMIKEVEASLTSDGLRLFQADPQVSLDLDELAQALQVQPKPQDGKPACIYLGDIISDRFTNNQQAMSKFIHKLSGVDPQDPGSRTDTGVRFIAGNHDTMPLLNRQGEDAFARNKTNPRGIVMAEQWGAFASQKLSLADYQALLQNCFKAADYSEGVLTTHNGVAAGSGPNDYLVGVGKHSQRGDHLTGQGNLLTDAMRVSASSPQELAEKMNEAFADRVRQTGGKDVISTEFRPNDTDMTPSALGLGHVPGFRQLHGHNESANEAQEGVTNLNARGAGAVGGFMPVGKVIAYAAPLTPAQLVVQPPLNVNMV